MRRRSLYLVLSASLFALAFAAAMFAPGALARPVPEPDGAGGVALGVLQDECSPRPVTPIGTDFFIDISEASGIQVENYDPDPPSRIPINDHSRLGFVDINGDGYDDIVAHSLFPNPRAGVPFEHLVFLNNRDGTFEHFSDQSGLRDIQSGFFAFGDIDNDGDQDAFAGLDIADHPDRSQTHQILLNDGSGHFTQLPSSGVEVAPEGAIAGNAVFADFDGDTFLDLYVGNGQSSYAGSDLLFRGRGDGTFEDASGSLVGNEPRPTNGTVACDYDDDGDIDIFVATYGVSYKLGHNVLWENDGDGTFRDVALERGFHALATGNYALRDTGLGLDPEPGKEPNEWVGSNAFGVQCDDVNGDGHMDIFLATISHPNSGDYGRKWSDPSQLLINSGPEGAFSFTNEFLLRDLPFNEGDVDGAVVDFDNDGLLDLSVSRDKKYEGGYTEIDQKSWFGLMHQLPGGAFESVGYTSGINDAGDDPFNKMKMTQNHAWSDFDHDGDMDLLAGGRDTSGAGRPNFLFENQIGSQNDWLVVQLVGDGVNINRDAIGTRVEISSGDTRIVREVKTNRSMYNSMDMRALHFGLGELPCDAEMRVRWPDGRVDLFDATEIGRNRWLRLAYGGAPEVLPKLGPEEPVPPTATAIPTAEPHAHAHACARLFAAALAIGLDRKRSLVENKKAGRTYFQRPPRFDVTTTSYVLLQLAEIP